METILISFRADSVMIKCLKDTKQLYALLKSILLKHIYPWRLLQFVHHTNTKKKKGATGVKEFRMDE